MRTIYISLLILLPALSFGQNNLYDFKANPLPDSFTYFHIDELAQDFIWIYKKESQEQILNNAIFIPTVRQHYTNEYKHLIEEKGVKHFYLDMKMGHQYQVDKYFETGDETYLDLEIMDVFYHEKLKILRPYVVSGQITVECYQNYFYYDMWMLTESVKKIAYEKRFSKIEGAIYAEMWNVCGFTSMRHESLDWSFQDSLTYATEELYEIIEDSIKRQHLSNNTYKSKYDSFYREYIKRTYKRNPIHLSNNDTLHRLYLSINNKTHEVYKYTHDSIKKTIYEQFRVKNEELTQQTKYFTPRVCDFFNSLNLTQIGSRKNNIYEIYELGQQVLEDTSLREDLHAFFGEYFHYIETMFRNFPYSEDIRELRKRKNAPAFYQLRVNQIYGLVLKDTVNKSYIEIQDNMFAGLCGCKHKPTPYQQQMYLQISALARNSYWMQSAYNSSDWNNTIVPEGYDNSIGYYQFTNTTAPVLFFLFKYD